MRDYAKVGPHFWIGETGKKLRQAGTTAQVVGLCLMTGPHANMLGLYYLPKLYIAHETGLGIEGASKLRTRAGTGEREATLSRRPLGWQLPSEWRIWAQQERPDRTPEKLQRVAEQFRDHWLAKAGADARKVDGQAPWRNWVRREQSFYGLAR